MLFLVDPQTRRYLQWQNLSSSSNHDDQENSPGPQAYHRLIAQGNNIILYVFVQSSNIQYQRRSRSVDVRHTTLLDWVCRLTGIKYIVTQQRLHNGRNGAIWVWRPNAILESYCWETPFIPMTPKNARCSALQVCCGKYSEVQLSDPLVHR